MYLNCKAHQEGGIAYEAGTTAAWRIQIGTTSTATIPAGLSFNESENSVGSVVVANRLVIREGGNIGIGTDNPLSRLHVNGDVRIDSNNIIVQVASTYCAITVTDLSYLDGLSSNIQTSLLGKVSTTDYNLILSLPH